MGAFQAAQWSRIRRPAFDPWVGTIPWKRKWQPTPVFLPAESHEQRGLAATVCGVTKGSRDGHYLMTKH